MKKFKCPICGCMEHYPMSFIALPQRERTGTGYTNDPYMTTVKIPRTILTYDFEISGDASGRFSLEGAAEVYLCSECGHIEFFGESMLREINKEKEEFNTKIKELEKEIEELKNALSSSNHNEYEKTKKRAKELAELLNSEDITVKQQREYKEESILVNSKMRELENVLSDIKRKIDKKTRELADVKSRAEKIVKYKSIETRKGMF